MKRLRRFDLPSSDLDRAMIRVGDSAQLVDGGCGMIYYILSCFLSVLSCYCLLFEVQEQSNTNII